MENSHSTTEIKENKKKHFDEQFRAFVKQAQETINERYGKSLEFGSENMDLLCLNRYFQIYNQMNSPPEHYRYFETVFNKNRQEILKTLEQSLDPNKEGFEVADNWIRNGKIVIQFGEGIKVEKEKEEKMRQLRINISNIYLVACDLQEKAEKNCDGIDEQFVSDLGGKDLIRPNILLLHLIRIFYYLNEGSDKAPLLVIVNQLEDMLGVKTKTGEPVITNNQSNTSTPVTGGLSGLFNMATNVMDKMGYRPPAGLKPPTENEITQVINNVFNNPQTQNAIQGMISSLNGVQDFGTVINSVIKNVTAENTMDALQTSIKESTQELVQNRQDQVIPSITKEEKS
jgi:hypothetical protein